MRLFFRNVTVLIADGIVDRDGYSHTIDKVECPESVPVTYNFNEKLIVGTAKLKKVGNEVRADLELNSNILEEMPIARLVPSAGGRLLDGFISMNGIEGRIVIKTVGLVSDNSDERIKPILG